LNRSARFDIVLKEECIFFLAAVFNFNNFNILNFFNFLDFLNFFNFSFVLR
jgi:hypothetical protein